MFLRVRREEDILVSLVLSDCKGQKKKRVNGQKGKMTKRKEDNRTRGKADKAQEKLEGTRGIEQEETDIKGGTGKGGNMQFC
jgi:hypothetical protein